MAIPILIIVFFSLVAKQEALTSDDRQIRKRRIDLSSLIKPSHMQVLDTCYAETTNKLISAAYKIKTGKSLESSPLYLAVSGFIQLDPERREKQLNWVEKYEAKSIFHIGGDPTGLYEQIANGSIELGIPRKGYKHDEIVEDFVQISGVFTPTAFNDENPQVLEFLNNFEKVTLQTENWKVQKNDFNNDALKSLEAFNRYNTEEWKRFCRRRSKKQFDVILNTLSDGYPLAITFLTESLKMREGERWIKQYNSTETAATVTTEDNVRIGKHMVVVVGYFPRSEELLVYDPASPQFKQYLSVNELCRVQYIDSILLK